MKMWSLDIIVLLLFCYARLSTATANGTVTFFSKNFTNVLHWDAAEPKYPEEKLLYSVQYYSHGRDTDGHLQIKKECQNITALSCDLTAETPSLPHVTYHAVVSVNGRELGRTRTRFNPMAHTILGPPTLSKRTTGSTLIVNVTLPLGPNGVSVADIIKESKDGPLKTIIVYTLKITEPKWAALVHETHTAHFVINLKKQTKYCGHVIYAPSSEWGRPESESAPFCVILPDHPLGMLPWLSSVVAFLVISITVTVALMCNYVKGVKKVRLPDSIARIFKDPGPVLQADSNIIISKVMVSLPNDQTPYAAIQFKPKEPAVKSGDYSPQDIPWQGSRESFGTNIFHPTLNGLDVSGQSSDTYGAVAAQMPAEEAEDRETCTVSLVTGRDSRGENGNGPQSMSPRDAPTPHLDESDGNPAAPLLLSTVRDDNGQLVLPSLASLLQCSTGDALSPLLSDIDGKKPGPSLSTVQSFDHSEWSDSGCDDSSVTTPTLEFCNTHYAAAQPTVSHYSPQQSLNTESNTGYKQNWMPEILHGGGDDHSFENSKINNHWTWTEPGKQDHEENTDRGETQSTQILLENWMVQIHDS